jgi:hypothetical protein
MAHITKYRKMTQKYFDLPAYGQQNLPQPGVTEQACSGRPKTGVAGAFPLYLSTAGAPPSPARAGQEHAPIGCRVERHLERVCHSKRGTA